MTFIRCCQQPLTSAPSVFRLHFTADTAFLSLTLFTLPKEKREKGCVCGKALKRYFVQFLNTHTAPPPPPQPWGTILVGFLKHPGKTLTLQYHLQAYDVYGFHLPAQSIFWLSRKFCELDKSEMSVSTLQRWEQRQEYVNCQPNLSQTSQTRHTIRHMPMFIASHLHQGKNRVFQVQSIFRLPLRVLQLKIGSVASMCCIIARISNWKPTFRMNLPLTKVEVFLVLCLLNWMVVPVLEKHYLILTLPRCHPKDLSHLSTVWGPEFE